MHTCRFYIRNPIETNIAELRYNIKKRFSEKYENTLRFLAEL